MTGEPEATLIVTLSGAADFDATKKQLMKIRGVNSVELICASNKLRVRYDGDSKRNLAIKADILKVIASNGTVKHR